MRRLGILLATTTILTTFVPPVAADHIAFADAAQTGAGPDGRVEITFTLATDGDLYGGEWTFSTGDGAWGAFGDGFVEGRYAGDARGTGALSDGRPFDWVRVGAQPIETHGLGDPGAVAYVVSYAYDRAGVYLGSWQNCCRHVDNHLVIVALDPDDPTRIPRTPLAWIDPCERLDDAVHCASKLLLRGSLA